MDLDIDPNNLTEAEDSIVVIDNDENNSLSSGPSGTSAPKPKKPRIEEASSSSQAQENKNLKQQKQEKQITAWAATWKHWSEKTPSNHAGIADPAVLPLPAKGQVTIQTTSASADINDNVYYCFPCVQLLYKSMISGGSKRLNFTLANCHASRIRDGERRHAPRHTEMAKGKATSVPSDWRKASDPELKDLLSKIKNASVPVTMSSTSAASTTANTDGGSDCNSADPDCAGATTSNDNDGQQVLAQQSMGSASSVLPPPSLAASQLLLPSPTLLPVSLPVPASSPTPLPVSLPVPASSPTPLPVSLPVPASSPTPLPVSLPVPVSSVTLTQYSDTVTPLPVPAVSVSASLPSPTRPAMHHVPMSASMSTAQSESRRPRQFTLDEIFQSRTNPSQTQQEQEYAQLEQEAGAVDSFKSLATFVLKSVKEVHSLGAKVDKLVRQQARPSVAPQREQNESTIAKPSGVSTESTDLEAKMKSIKTLDELVSKCSFLTLIEGQREGEGTASSVGAPAILRCTLCYTWLLKNQKRVPVDQLEGGGLILSPDRLDTYRQRTKGRGFRQFKHRIIKDHCNCATHLRAFGELESESEQLNRHMTAAKALVTSGLSVVLSGTGATQYEGFIAMLYVNNVYIGDKQHGRKVCNSIWETADRIIMRIAAADLEDPLPSTSLPPFFVLLWTKALQRVRLTKL
ncbi:hypothetical protein BOX15_Mlig007389g1 [Macrostomum lignano]|uniref:Uncharacterized protein n=1 Tax=Macrostomum lignano TaxID=282301 RepID=A0A267G152_9PLAT|nr:hypothetical protein BOX15_Mlig007389g1 [Macrostomum lignano]